MTTQHHNPRYFKAAWAVALLIAVLWGGVVWAEGNTTPIPFDPRPSGVSSITNFTPGERLVLHAFGAAGDQQYSQALYYYRQMAESPDFTSPQRAAGYVMLGRILSMMDRRDEAENAFRKGLSLEPDSVMGEHYLAKLLEREGKRAEAVAAYREAMRLNPDYLPAFLDLGNLYEASDDLALAADVYRQAWENNKDNTGVAANLARVLARDGKKEEARRVVTAVLRLNPTSAELQQLDRGLSE